MPASDTALVSNIEILGFAVTAVPSDSDMSWASCDYEEDRMVRT